MDVVTLKLINGEEIIGNLVGNMNTIHGIRALHIDDALILQVVPDPQTQQPMRVFANWPAMAAPGQTVQIPLTAISSLPIKPHEELERQYVSNITGLELPPAQPKILLS